MNKKGKLTILISLGVRFLLTAVYARVFVFSDDREPPTITVDTDTVEISVYDGQNALLRGVSATDDKDGDITADIMVENVSNITENCYATVTYAVYDSAGNVAKASRTVLYTDYESPKIGQSERLVFAANTSPDVLGFMTAECVIDGDISGRVKGTLVSEGASLSNVGTHSVEFRVTNSMGDTRRLTLPVDVYRAGDYNCKVNLTQYLIYLKKGDEFSARDYVYSVKVGNSEYILDREFDPDLKIFFDDYVSPAVNPEATIVNIETESNVDTNTPGVYSVAYTVNYDGRYDGFSRLNVVVEE